MENYNNYPSDSWEYGTGRTDPPKSRGGLIALLLILVIFLTGIVTVLGLLNIRLVRQLDSQPRSEDLTISFAPEQRETLPAAQATEPVSADLDRFSMDLEQSPEASANIPQPEGLSLQEIYQRNIPSVVSISCTLRGGSSTGTGVVLSADGYIVTNAHVVADAVAVTVQLTDNRVFAAQLIGSDSVSDLAVLHVEAEDLTPASFGDSDILRVGDSVVAIGDPLGVELRGTMTDGIVSAINRDLLLEGRTMSLIQTNAALNSGNSGGPLINCFGQVIGINTMKIGDFVSAAGVEGLGFAIPSATVKTVVDQLVTQGYVSGRPTLGITGETLSVFYQHYYRLPAGLYLTQVAPGSPAARAGIEAGDILLTLDDTPITTPEELTAFLFSHDIGDTVTVTVYRAGKQGTAKLTIAEDQS